MGGRWWPLDLGTCLPLCALLQAEVCSGTVADVLQAVVSGADGCVFSFGHTSLGERCPSLCGGRAQCPGGEGENLIWAVGAVQKLKP